LAVSRHISSSESDTEGTTALPKMQRRGPNEGDKEAKEKDRHLFERVGLFKKKKG